MRRFSPYIVLLLFLLGNSGCTYTGQLRDNFYRPGSPANSKLPLKVALVREKKEQHFAVSGFAHGVDIDVYPALIQSTASALSGIFDSVQIIDNPLQSKDLDLLGFVRFGSRELKRARDDNYILFDAWIELTLKEAASKEMVSKAWTSGKATWTTPAEAYVASALTGGSAFLLSPITIPWTTQAIGRRAEELLESTIENLLRAMVVEVTSEPYLAAFSKDKTVRLPSPEQGTSPSQKGGAGDNKSPSSGTGFIINRHGNVLTNHHVVDGCSSIRTSFEGRQESLSVVRSDPANDLALLKLSAPVSSYATIREGHHIRPGDSVVAVGFPLFGLLSSEANVTIGNVSALAGIGNDTRFLQITAPVQPGNSGGPLLDQSGNVVGMIVGKLNAIKIAKITGDVPQNVNFAINAATVRMYLDAIGVEYAAVPQLGEGHRIHFQALSGFAVGIVMSLTGAGGLYRGDGSHHLLRGV